ncbi:MAG: hypothetical protein WC624_03955 [Candidatus Margulisiibacteriota bacterium]
MKNNIIALVIGFLILAGSQSMAASKPSWALFSDTAYTLKEGKWNVSLIGWANYGLSNKIQIGTNALLTLFQIPNVYGKYVVVEESDSAPQISLGSSIYYPLAASTPISTDYSVIISRGIDNGNYILHGGLKLTANINDSSQPSSNPINTPGLGYKAGLITNQSDLTHLFFEAYSNWIPIGRSSEIAVGADFLSEGRTISFGGLFYAADSSDRRANILPFANVQWNF